MQGGLGVMLYCALKPADLWASHGRTLLGWLWKLCLLSLDVIFKPLYPIIVPTHSLRPRGMLFLGIFRIRAASYLEPHPSSFPEPNCEKTNQLASHNVAEQSAVLNGFLSWLRLCRLQTVSEA